jgi:ribosomal-protein-serine acetyltransferase
MTAAVGAYLELVFASWDLNRVELGAAADNERSRALARRLGFREEGIRREAEAVGDRRDDVVVHSLLAAEWRAAPSESPAA